MKNILELIIDAVKNDDMNCVIELAEKQQDKFCDNNCVWTDHHPECVRAEPEWYHVIDVHGCNRFYHRTEDCPYKVKTPLYTTPPPKQEQDEPVAWYHVENNKIFFTASPSKELIEKYWTPLYTAPQPKQEPVAEPHKGEPVGEMVAWPNDFERVGVDWISYVPDVGTKLYTTPQQRTWVGLTDEEKADIAAQGHQRWKEYAEAIEAKLKEKNT